MKSKILIIVLFSIVSTKIYAAKAIWEGNESSLWDVSANWKGGRVPQTNDDIIIQSCRAFQPCLVGDVTCNSLTLAGSTSLCINKYVLTINKYFVNKGLSSYIMGTDSTQAKIVFTGKVGRSLDKSTFYNSGNLTISNSTFNLNAEGAEVYNYGGKLTFISTFIQNEYGNANDANPLKIYVHDDGIAKGSLALNNSTMYFVDNSRKSI
jgi:hypothetical protein